MIPPHSPADPSAPLVALLDEMRALLGILPGGIQPAQSPDPFAGLTAEQAACIEDEAMEAGFDNMPV